MCLCIALDPGWQATTLRWGPANQPQYLPCGQQPRQVGKHSLDVLRVCRHYDQLLTEYSAPKEGSQQLKFDTKYPKPMYAQFVAIFTKFMAAYWRMPGASALSPVQSILGPSTAVLVVWRQLRTSPALTQGAPALTTSAIVHGGSIAPQGSGPSWLYA